jgi:sugar phosphate isomerase/epimerase
MQIGISTLVDLEVPFPELAQMIGRAGFTHLSLSHDIAHAGYQHQPGRAALARALADAGLKLNYIHTALDYSYDMASLDDQTRLITKEVYRLAIMACAELGGKSIVAHACGRHPMPEEDVAEQTRLGLEVLRELCEYAAERGVQVCIENLPKRYGFQTVTQRIMEEAYGWENLWFCIDTCHATMENDSRALEQVRWLGAKVGQTHFSDTKGSEDSHLIPFEGHVDFKGICQILGEAGYDGVIDLECSLWMLRNRIRQLKPHPGDPALIETQAYLEQAATAAKQCWEWVQAARQ